MWRVVFEGRVAENVVVIFLVESRRVSRAYLGPKSHFGHRGSVYLGRGSKIILTLSAKGINAFYTNVRNIFCFVDSFYKKIFFVMFFFLLQ